MRECMEDNEEFLNWLFDMEMVYIFVFKRIGDFISDI